MSRRAWFWLAAGVLITGAGVAWAGVDATPGDGPKSADACAPLKKRAEVAVAEPVVIGGVRYEAPADGKAHGLGQNGGYIVARDERSGAQLWALKVYAIDYAANMEADKQDVFITEMKASPDCTALLVTDERGRHWRIDLHMRTSAPD